MWICLDFDQKLRRRESSKFSAEVTCMGETSSYKCVKLEIEMLIDIRLEASKDYINIARIFLYDRRMHVGWMIGI